MKEPKCWEWWKSNDIVILSKYAVTGRLGKTFLDCAVKMRKMKSKAELIRLIEDSFGVRHEEVEEHPLSCDVRVPNGTRLARKTFTEDLARDVMSICFLAHLGTLSREEELEFLLSLRQDRKIPPDLEARLSVACENAMMSASYLWEWFRDPSNILHVVSKDAFDLVANTKFDENVTKEMFEAAFPEKTVVFFSMKKAYKGYREFSMMRHGCALLFSFGPDVEHPTWADLHDWCDHFITPVCIFDAEKQLGNMTNDSLCDSAEQNLTAYLDAMSRNDDTRMSEGADDVRMNDLRTLGVAGSDDRRKFTSEVVTWLVMFAMKLRLMLTSERAPVEETRSSSGKGVWKAGIELPPEKGVGIRYSVVSLTKDFYEARARYEKSSGHIDRDGRSLVEKQVCGHLRRQHYGPKSSLTKYIYVSPFVNRFWMSENTVHVTKVVK